MLSYEKSMDWARKNLAEYLTEDPQEAIEKDLYLVKDIAEVFTAYAEDLEKIEDIYDNCRSEDIDQAIKSAYDEDFEEFFARHEIDWE